MFEAITFTVMGKPVPQGRPRFARGKHFVQVYSPNKSDKNDFIKVAKQYAPGELWDCPIEMTLTFYMPIPKSSKSKTGEYHVKKPDIDNLIKLTVDAMIGVFFVDDNQICQISASKIYSQEPCTMVTIEKQI